MEKRVALVTGAGGGIGRAIAMQLAKSDMDIAIHYNSNRTKAEETQKLCEEFGAKVHLIQGDISTEETCKEVVEEVIKEFGTIDVLINNAGITKDGLFIRMKEEDFNQVIDTNLKGAFFMSKYAAQVMLKKRYGRIVNITSVVGIGGNAGQANYSASKAGMIGLTKSLAKELGRQAFSQSQRTHFESNCGRVHGNSGRYCKNSRIFVRRREQIYYGAGHQCRWWNEYVGGICEKKSCNHRNGSGFSFGK